MKASLPAGFRRFVNTNFRIILTKILRLYKQNFNIFGFLSKILYFNVRIPESFAKTYPDASFQVITPQNVDEFILMSQNRTRGGNFEEFALCVRENLSLGPGPSDTAQYTLYIALGGIPEKNMYFFFEIWKNISKFAAKLRKNYGIFY